MKTNKEMRKLARDSGRIMADVLTGPDGDCDSLAAMGNDGLTKVGKWRISSRFLGGCDARVTNDASRGMRSIRHHYGRSAVAV
jgi:hypothetical protein